MELVHFKNRKVIIINKLMPLSKRERQQTVEIKIILIINSRVKFDGKYIKWNYFFFFNQINNNLFFKNNETILMQCKWVFILCAVLILLVVNELICCCCCWLFKFYKIYFYLLWIFLFDFSFFCSFNLPWIGNSCFIMISLMYKNKNKKKG